MNFLRRRLYENYLLSPAAISAVVNEIDRFRTPAVSPDEVEAFIEKARREDVYYKNLKGERSAEEADWILDIHAAKLLEVLFSSLSETRVVFDKVKHSVALTEWLIRNDPVQLAEITSLLKDLLEQKETG